jgi:hypothetical protein
MYNCYNEAFDYMCKTYGSTQIQYGSQHNKTTRTFNTPTDKGGEAIALLLKQYCYGIDAKRDLYFKMLNMGVIKEEINLIPTPAL